MTQKLLFAFCILMAATAVVAAQTRTVTNADLEKYRQQRLAAEREYDANHARLGLPSREELERRRDAASAAEREIAARLRSDELEERIAAERPASIPAPPVSFERFERGFDSPFYQLPYFYSYGVFPRRGHRRPYFQQGYFAGGAFWPTGPATKPRRMFVQVRPGRRR